MKNSLTRRHFLKSSIAAAAGTAMASPLLAEEGVSWEIGCFNRPWGTWSYDTALDQMKAAGFQTTGLVGRHKQDPESLLSVDARVPYIKELRERIHARGLKPLTAWMTVPRAKEQAEAVRLTNALTDRAQLLGLPWLLSGGPRSNEKVEDYSAVMKEAVRHAAEKGVKIAMKPHGLTGAQIIQTLELVNHDNFSIWYDAGNIIYYTGGDPIADLKPLAPHVTGFCAKDCGGQKSPVMIQFGEGKVDFKGVFQVLMKAGFNGPVMIECTGTGATAEETTKFAVQNRRFLTKVMKTV